MSSQFNENKKRPGMAHFKTTFDYFDLLKTYVGFDF